MTRTPACRRLQSRRSRFADRDLSFPKFEEYSSPQNTPIFTPEIFAMSMHPSLKGKGTIAAKRNVLKRYERVEVLKKRGQFKAKQSVIGLPKTKPDV